MLRMELLASGYVRVGILSIGLLLSMYKAYHLKMSIRTIIDIIIVFLMVFYMTQSVSIITFKMAMYLVVTISLLIFNHKVNYHQASLFSFVILFMLSISDLISLQLINYFQYLNIAIQNQDTGVAGFVAVVLPSIIVAINYYIASIILSKVILLHSNRVGIVYLVISAFNIYFILQLSSLIEYIVVNWADSVTRNDLFNIISVVYLSVLFIPMFTVLVLIGILKNNNSVIEQEQELLKIYDARFSGYRYNHNFTGIILSINYLAKDNNFDEINKYLGKM